MKAKGRAPRHEQDVEHKLRKETPTVSADLCYTGFGDSDEHKLIALVMIDSSNGLMQAVPIDAKANIMYMAKEVVRFMNFSSHGEVHFGMNPMITRNDQEPTMLKLQQTVRCNSPTSANCMCFDSGKNRIETTCRPCVDFTGICACFMA